MSDKKAKQKQINREYYIKNKEKLKAQSKAYRLKNKAKVNAWFREYYKKNKQHVLNQRKTKILQQLIDELNAMDIEPKMNESTPETTESQQKCIASTIPQILKKETTELPTIRDNITKFNTKLIENIKQQILKEMEPRLIQIIKKQLLLEQINIYFNKLNQTI